MKEENIFTQQMANSQNKQRSNTIASDLIKLQLNKVASIIVSPMNLESERTDRQMRDPLESVRSGVDFDEQSDSQVSDFQHQAIR